ncbi:MAG: ribosome maturation factor RimP [Actinomycetota bacterium]|nr:ribosome maturation factor RimP [Actinomycetota bacterium]
MPPATAGRSADSSAATRQHLRELLGPVVASAGYDLDDVTVTAAGRRKLVRVSVDADGGIDLDAVAAVSRLISETLDAQDTDVNADKVFAGSYVLEVSSPGVDRPLTEPRHWHRAVGRLIEITIGTGLVTGRLVGTSPEGVTLDLKGVQRQLSWPELGRGRVQVEFNPPGAAAGTGVPESPGNTDIPGARGAKGAQRIKRAGKPQRAGRASGLETGEGFASEPAEEG